jgi:hypothetical protein
LKTGSDRVAQRRIDVVAVLPIEFSRQPEDRRRLRGFAHHDPPGGVDMTRRAVSTILIDKDRFSPRNPALHNDSDAAGSSSAPWLYLTARRYVLTAG